MSFRIDHEKLLQKFKFILTKIENLKVLNEMLCQSMMEYIYIYKPKERHTAIKFILTFVA